MWKTETPKAKVVREEPGDWVGVSGKEALGRVWSKKGQGNSQGER